MFVIVIVEVTIPFWATVVGVFDFWTVRSEFWTVVTTVPVIVGEPGLVNVAWFEKFVPEGVFAGTVPVIVMVAEPPAANAAFVQVTVAVTGPQVKPPVGVAVTPVRSEGMASTTVTFAAAPPVLVTVMT